MSGKFSMRKIVKQAFRKFGYRISRVDKGKNASDDIHEMHGLFYMHNPKINVFRRLSGDKVSLSQRDSFKEKLQSNIYQLESYACPICNNEEFTPVASSEEGFQWGLCNCCGLLQMHTRLRHQDLKSFYESGEYHAICIGNLDDRSCYAGEYKYMALFFLDVLERLQISTRNLSVVDIGCGYGGILRALKEKGAIVKGYDLDSHRVEYGRRFIREIEVADAMDDSIELPKELDILLLSNVLEHLNDPQQFLIKLAEKLPSNKVRLMLDVPNVDGTCACSDEAFGEFLNIAHLWSFNPITIERTLNQAGFKVDSIFNYGIGMTVISRRSGEPMNNCNNAFWSVVSAIHHANFRNDPNNILLRARQALQEEFD